MSRQLTAEDARESLSAHVAGKGIEVFCKHGPRLGWVELQRLLADTECVRYPTEIVFDAAPLLPSECAHAAPRGERPEDGYTLFVHPHFRGDPDGVVRLALYQLVVVNYGPFAAPHDAEAFGAAALGLTCDEYYVELCALADQLADAADSPVRVACEHATAPPGSALDPPSRG